MTEEQKLLIYYNGITAFYNYLAFYLNEQEYRDALIIDKESIRNAKVAFLALFFTTEKESLVEKDILGVNKNEFDSKVIDEALIKSIEMIAIKNNDYYEIGSYKEKNPANIIALIRNKFAHGRYDIDAENNLVILNDKKGTLNLELDLDKLYLLVCSSLINLISYPKTDSVTRIHAINKHLNDLKIDRIKTIEDAKMVLKTSRFKEYNLTTYDGSKIDAKALRMFNLMLNTIKKYGEDEGIVNQLVSKFREIANEQKMQINISKRRVKDNDIEQILSQIDFDSLFECEDVDNQVKLLLSRAVEYLSPNYQKNSILNGLINNMMLLSRMEDDKDFDFDKTFLEDDEKFYSVAEESAVSALIAEFMALYIYPLERIYLNGTDYSCDRNDQFDFSTLNLNNFNPKKITIYDSQLKQQTSIYDSKIDRLYKKRQNIIRLKDNLEKVKSNGNIKAIETIEKELERTYSELFDLSLETNEAINIYNSIRDDYRNNPEYFKNRAIIEGIRNAIAHGHIKLKKVGNIDNTIIIFKDIYNGEVTFELEITLKDFEILFSEENILMITKFLSNRGNGLYYPLNAKKFIKE